MFIDCLHKASTLSNCLVTCVRSHQCGRCPVSLNSPQCIRNRSGFVDGLEHFLSKYCREMSITKTNSCLFNSWALLWKSLLRWSPEVTLSSLTCSMRIGFIKFSSRMVIGLKNKSWWKRGIFCKCMGHCTFVDFYSYFWSSSFLMKKL